jgi:hypothetical protein
MFTRASFTRGQLFRVFLSLSILQFFIYLFIFFYKGIEMLGNPTLKLMCHHFKGLTPYIGLHSKTTLLHSTLYAK